MAIETIEVLLRRIETIELLVEQPMDKRELVERLGVSRSTVDRATRELETAGLVAYSGDGFELTSLGRTATTEFFGLVDGIELRQQLEPFFRWIPDGEFDIDCRLLADAEVVLAEPGDPYSMINRHVERIKNTECSRAVLPFTGLHAQETAHEQIVHHGARSKLVVESEIAEVQRSDHAYAKLTSEMQATGRFEVFEYDGEIPYCVALFDDTVQIIVAEDDQPRALLESDSGEVYDWAERKYREHEESATQILP